MPPAPAIHGAVGPHFASKASALLSSRANSIITALATTNWYAARITNIPSIAITSIIAIHTHGAHQHTGTIIKITVVAAFGKIDVFSDGAVISFIVTVAGTSTEVADAVAVTAVVAAAVEEGGGGEVV